MAFTLQTGKSVGSGTAGANACRPGNAGLTKRAGGNTGTNLDVISRADQLVSPRKSGAQMNNSAATATVLWIFTLLFLIFSDPWWLTAWAFLGLSLVMRRAFLSLIYSAIFGSSLGFSLKMLAVELQVPAWWSLPAAFLLSFYFPYVICRETSPKPENDPAGPSPLS